MASDVVPAPPPTRLGVLPSPAPSHLAHVTVRAVLLAGGLAVIGLWWLDGGSLHGAGAYVTALGRLSGLLGAYLVLVQVLLMSRVPWFERAVGFDRLAAWHRGLGTNTVLLLGLHVGFITFGYAEADHRDVVRTGWHIATGYPDMLKAIAGFGIFVGVAFASGRTMRARLSYESWYWIHLTTYAAIALAFQHQLSTGADFIGHPLNRMLWIAMYAVVAGSVVLWRVIDPVRAWFVHRMVVDKVVHEGPGVVSVWIRGHRLAELDVRAGQFMLWRFVTPGHLWSAHPYSLSAAPDGRHLRITVKASGDHSRSLAWLRHGTPVLAEGPFGHFTTQRRTRSRVLLVAGGAGIGPLRALAEELLVAERPQPGSVVLLYRVSRPVDLVLRHEIEELAARYGLVVHYLVGRRHELPSDPLAPRSIARLVPDVRDRDCYVCGPPGMTHRVLSTLRRLHVAPRQVHAEEFAL